MDRYPLLEPYESSNAEKYIREVAFWSHERGASLLRPLDGIVDWVCRQVGPDFNKVVDYLQPHFSNLTVLDLALIIESLVLMFGAYHVAKDIKHAREPKPWDSGDQVHVLKFLRENLSKPDAAARFAAEAVKWGEGSPPRLIFDGIRFHLQGMVGQGSAELSRFERLFKPADSDLKQLIDFRIAKVFAGSGQLEKADARYEMLSRQQGKLERAETIREQCM